MARLEEFGTLALITWHDTHSDDQGWLHIGDIDPTPCVVHSVGWLIPTHEGGKPDHVTLYQTRIEGTDQIDSVAHIPVGMVVKVKLLNRTEFR
jgi:hypothetical protein